MAESLTLIELEDRLGPALHDAETGVSPPVILDRRYHLLKIVGRGARGIVCKSRDVRLDRLVAVKLYLAEPSIVREVEHEAKALARLDHPNIVGVHDAGHTEIALGMDQFSCLVLVMDFIEGGSLRRWLQAGPHSRAEILSRFFAVGAGLEAAHQAGFIHRDLKPENMMIDADGTCRLVDFGLARKVEVETARQAGNEERHTAFGGVTGTLEYMAPEARAGKATAASDQFSLAVAIWEALTGTLPFDPQRGEWRLANSTDFTGAARLPAPIAAVLRRGLSYDPRRPLPLHPYVLRCARGHRPPATPTHVVGVRDRRQRRPARRRGGIRRPALAG
jgi:serine/threonine protein kinase